MLINKNPYTLRKEDAGGMPRYYVSFTDGQAVLRETEVSYPIYLELLRFAKAERNLWRWDERHTELSGLTEETLYQRALYQPKSLEDTVFDQLRSEQLRLAIQRLPKIQRRRFVLYHEHSLTYEQIAEMEGCHFTSVRESVVRAEGKIKKIIQDF